MTGTGELERVFVLSDEEIVQNNTLGERNEYDETVERESAVPSEDLSGFVSDASHDLVLFFEVGGADGYERRYRFPCWPQGASGVTIGIGYDLGYNTKGDIDASWREFLAEEPLRSLLATAGLKGASARAALASVASVEVPYVAAQTVYRRMTVPRFSRLADATFPGARTLHPHCFGALFSLVYNRGGSLSGERRRHMRNIRDHIAANQPEKIPGEFRAMKSIWPPSMSGLHKRREAEARLFETGLADAKKAAEPVVATLPPAPAAANAEGPEANMALADGDWMGEPPDITEDEIAPPSFDTEANRDSAGWTRVSWVADEDDSTEYRHTLPADRGLKSSAFSFNADDLDLLFKANRYEPVRENGAVVFGLRGAELTGTGADKVKQVDRDALSLRETRPDHAEFRCVIGIHHLGSRRLSGFIASTVAKRAAVYAYFINRKSGNLLPCGCYAYVVGRHTTFQGCLRENEPFAVLRSANDPAYDVRDIWDLKPGFNDWPYDNIHPAFADQTGSSPFSSIGCQVIRGGFNRGTGKYTGEFAEFRSGLGLLKPGEGDYGKKFSYVLLTGLEAAIAAKLRTDVKSGDLAAVQASLGRLRHGSRGAEVSRLQGALGTPVTGYFDGVTRIKLTEKQTAARGWADGVYGPDMDAALGFSVFEQPAAPAPQPATV